jgi:peptide/nickel transport system permease protein
MVVVTVVVTLITFVLIHLVPGDPALTILGQRANPEAVAALHAQMHLDAPVPEQLWLFVRGAVTGDLGTSLVTGGTPVTHIIFPALRVTLSLIGLTALISLVVGLGLGILSGASGRGPTDLGIRSILMVALATPSFLTGLVLLLLALHTGIAPAGGWSQGFMGGLRHLWLPSVALSTYLTPIIARASRQSVKEALGQDFIEAAIARGLPTSTLIRKHVLRNSLLPVISLLGFNLGSLIGGAVIVEVIFDLPGIGTRLVSAVTSRDYPVVQGAALVTAILVIIISGVADLCYRLADPRTRSTS